MFCRKCPSRSEITNWAGSTDRHQLAVSIFTAIIWFSSKSLSQIYTTLKLHRHWMSVSTQTWLGVKPVNIFNVCSMSALSMHLFAVGESVEIYKLQIYILFSIELFFTMPWSCCKALANKLCLQIFHFVQSNFENFEKPENLYFVLFFFYTVLLFNFHLKDQCAGLNSIY